MVSVEIKCYCIQAFLTFTSYIQFTGYFRSIEGADEPVRAVAELARLMPEVFLSNVPCEGFVDTGQLQVTGFVHVTTYSKSSSAVVPASLFLNHYQSK